MEFHSSSKEGVAVGVAADKRVTQDKVDAGVQEEGHWVSDFPHLEEEQQAQLQMNVRAAVTQEKEEETEEAVGCLQVLLLQGPEGQCGLNKNRVYLDSCLTVTTFKNTRHLSNIKEADHLLRVNCNAGAVVTNKKGKFGTLKV